MKESPTTFASVEDMWAAFAPYEDSQFQAAPATHLAGQVPPLGLQQWMASPPYGSGTMHISSAPPDAAEDPFTST